MIDIYTLTLDSIQAGLSMTFIKPSTLYTT